MLQRDERVGSHVGVEQCAVPVVSFASVENQPIAHRGKRLPGAPEKLREQSLRTDVTPFNIGAVAPRDHLSPRELIIEEISLVLYAWETIGESPMKSRTVDRITGNRGAALRVGRPDSCDS